MITIDGKKIARHIRKDLRKQIKTMDTKPGLAVILIGDDSASHVYVGIKEKAAKRVGIFFERHQYDEKTSQKEVMKIIKELNNRDDIHGIIVQLPLPEHFDVDTIISAIDPNKDVDGFTPCNYDLYLKNKPTLISPVALSVKEVLLSLDIDLKQKKVLVLANSKMFGHCLTHMTDNLGVLSTKAIVRNACPFKEKFPEDIIITALGAPNCITKDMIKTGTICIDIGTTRLEDGSIAGDFNFESIKDKAYAITPVPGGIGPLTVAMLLKNVVQAAK